MSVRPQNRGKKSGASQLNVAYLARGSPYIHIAIPSVLDIVQCHANFAHYFCPSSVSLDILLRIIISRHRGVSEVHVITTTMTKLDVITPSCCSMHSVI
jgi:hypothetical protein